MHTAASLNSARQGNPIETIASRVTEACERINALSHRVETNGDALFGSCPRPCGESELSDVRSGQIGDVGDRLDVLFSAISRLEYASERVCFAA